MEKVAWLESSWGEARSQPQRVEQVCGVAGQGKDMEVVTGWGEGFSGAARLWGRLREGLWMEKRTLYNLFHLQRLWF